MIANFIASREESGRNGRKSFPFFLKAFIREKNLCYLWEVFKKNEDGNWKETSSVHLTARLFIFPTTLMSFTVENIFQHVLNGNTKVERISMKISRGKYSSVNLSISPSHSWLFYDLILCWWGCRLKSG